MDKRELYAYTAGLIDGEGYVSLMKAYKSEHRYIPCVKVVSTDPYMTVFLHTNFGGHLEKPRAHKFPQKTSRCWSVRNGKMVKEFLEQISPYLIVKKQHANLVLDYINSFSQSSQRDKATWDKRDEYYKQIRKLTKRGLAPAETE